MNTYKKIRSILEARGTIYHGPDGHTARVFTNKETGYTTAKLFKNGVHNKDTDFSHKDSDEVHDFAKEEMAIKRAQAKKTTNESLDPKDHIESSLADLDINSSVNGNVVKVHKSNANKAQRIIKKLGYDHKVESGLNEESVQERINMPQGHMNTPDPISDSSLSARGRVKKMMGNRTPMELIAKIIAKKE